jgi:hypothetical protein
VQNFKESPGIKPHKVNSDCKKETQKISKDYGTMLQSCLSQSTRSDNQDK